MPKQFVEWDAKVFLSKLCHFGTLWYTERDFAVFSIANKFQNGTFKNAIDCCLYIRIQLIIVLLTNYYYYCWCKLKPNQWLAAKWNRLHLDWLADYTSVNDQLNRLIDGRETNENAFEHLNDEHKIEYISVLCALCTVCIVYIMYGCTSGLSICSC